MGPEPELDLGSLARRWRTQGHRFLLIGRQAVVLYGAPVFSFDYDLWFPPQARRPVLSHLQDDLGCELSAAPDEPRPIVKVYSGGDRLDLFFVRALVNREGTELTFEDAWSRGEEQRAGDYAIRIPAIDDLITLKKMAATPRPKDEEDIRYLQVLKDLRSRGEGPREDPPK